MDHKMDSGFLEPGECLEDDYDVLRELLPEEVLGIMDQLLCYEVGLLLQRLQAGSISETDPRYRRWHGTWVIRSHNLSSPHYTSTEFCGRSRRPWRKPASIEIRSLSPGMRCYISFYGRIA